MLIYNSPTDYYYGTVDSGKGYVGHCVEGEHFTKTQALTARDLGDDVVSITLHQYTIDNDTHEVVELAGDEYATLYVTREHALEFANRIIQALGE